MPLNSQYSVSFPSTPGVSREPQDADHAVSDHPACTALGNEVMKLGGNAVDAAVGASLCLALVAPHVTGLGGGGLMMVHDHRANTSKVIDFRETTPENVRNDR